MTPKTRRNQDVGPIFKSRRLILTKKLISKDVKGFCDKMAIFENQINDNTDLRKLIHFV